MRRAVAKPIVLQLGLMPVRKAGPAGQVTRTIVPVGRRTDQMGRTYRLKAFRFDAAVCGACPQRSQCLAAKPVLDGRSGCTRRKLYCSRPAHCSTARVLLSIGNAAFETDNTPGELLSEGIPVL